MRPRTRDAFTIAIICALPLEADALEALFDETYDRLCKYYVKQQGDANWYVNGRVGKHNVVLCYMPGMGKISAASVASNLRISYTGVQLALVVGICGGAPKSSKSQDIFLGDVVVSDSVVTYEFDGEHSIHDRHGRPSREIRTLLGRVGTPSTQAGLQSQLLHYLEVLNQNEKRWDHPGIEDVLFESSHLHKHREHDSDLECCCLKGSSPDEICENALESDCDSLSCGKSTVMRIRNPSEANKVSIHVGPVASGNTVMKSGKQRDNIIKRDKVIGFEMEGAGVWECLPSLVIKGVCDYADSHKNKLWQAYAAATAASTAKAFLEHWTPQAQESDNTYRFMVPFSRNPRFLGRKDEIQHLWSLLSAPEGPRRLAISGLGGIGKTQIALELAYLMHEHDAECSVFWIPSTSDEAIEQACIAIAQQLGIQYTKPDEVKERLKEYLCQTSEEWVLIFDGADDMDMWMNGSGTTAPLGDFLPSNRHGHIIYTTRNRKSAVKLTSRDVIHVRELDEQAGVELLEKSLIQQDLVEDKDTATYLVKWLALLPQAITQAAATMNENEIGVYDYLMLLHEEEDLVKLLSEYFQADGRYEDSVNPIFLTWFASFRQIEKRDPLASEYLSLLACLGQQSIPESFLPRPVSRKKMIEALGLLKGYSFITIRPGDRCITLHRLVHLAARHWLRSQDRMELYTHKAAERLSEAMNNGHINEKHRRKYVQHAEFLLHGLHVMAVQAQWNMRIRSGGDERGAEEEELLVQGTDTLSHILES
ncbi:kinesin light chain [Aspergillus eucalypticola CBS 122712]|uniref:Kinesin light chain n=1 Tax=Aspergillus eucalypticola (strain CBS 122712 / IBT 29274) TaxID=1448314 RepID=A0A317W9T5_ASPEC|nr:kinesin light chain [Aspergillus eucalypticola CBS 122712]PWY82521.1 kinesin light chain [Aspergillus eucalypticola CBS 122712]